MKTEVKLERNEQNVMTKLNTYVVVIRTVG